MMRRIAGLALMAWLLTAAAVQGGGDVPPAPASMSLDELRTATIRNLGLLHALQREMLRRDPASRPFEGYDPAKAAATPEALTQIRGLSNSALVDTMAALSARIDALATEGSRRLAAQQAPAARTPMSRAPAAALPSASTDRKAYCKAMYAKAYMLCDREDRSCKFLAASHWEECEKTGQWRG